MNQAIDELRYRLRHSAAVPTKLLSGLIYGWNNSGWSADTVLLQALLGEHLERKQSILECGTGVTTLIFAIMSEYSGGQYRSLEHNAQWHHVVQQRLRSFGLPRDGVTFTPMRSHDDFDWYDTTTLPASETYDLVLCDGPPADTRGGRYGLLPQILPRLRPGARIIMDDAARRDEAQIIKRWLERYSDRLQLTEANATYAILTVT